MTVDSIVESRGIDEVLHFTTNRGLLGILHQRLLKSRERLEKDDTLEYIFSANAAFRKDTAWLDYVNLSISRINSQFYDISSGRWHRDEDIWWCILSFSAEILSHDGVFFATTNNMYTGVHRLPGPNGLMALFGEEVVRWNGNVVCRRASLEESYTTCEQAEVLYPRELSTEYLQRIYVVRDEDADEVFAQVSGVDHSEIEVVAAPEKFDRTFG